MELHIVRSIVLSVQPWLRIGIRKLQDHKAAKSFGCPLKGSCKA